MPDANFENPGLRWEDELRISSLEMTPIPPRRRDLRLRRVQGDPPIPPAEPTPILRATISREEWLRLEVVLLLDLLNPKPSLIHLEDIIWGLGFQCRFGGQCRKFYSVAEHSVHVMSLCEQYPREGLMHDASEAFIGDIPLARLLPEYKKIERNLEEAIADRFSLVFPWPAEVAAADALMLGAEARLLMPVELNEETRQWWEPFRSMAAPMLVGPGQTRSVGAELKCHDSWNSRFVFREAAARLGVESW